MNLINEAHDLQMAGFNPLPLKNNKAPMLPVGHNYLYESIDNIDVLFKNAEKIGIACGAVSDGFYCIDFDAHNNEPISKIFEQYINVSYIQTLISQGKLSIYSTAGGGYHIYFIYRDEILKGTSFAKWETKSVMIEIRGDGQYVACFPSNGYKHIKGVEYLKLNALEDPNEYKLIADLAKSFNQYKDQVGNRKVKSDRKWQANWKDTTPDGKYNIECESEAIELLTKFGWQFAGKRPDGTQYWTRPNKSIEDGFSATFNHFKGMFYVFSDDVNCKPFEPEQAYSPFNILSLLKYDGDWKRAKDELRKRFNMVDNEEFWSKNEKGSYSLNNFRFKEFLESNDFFKHSPNEASTFNFVQKDGIFLKIVYEKDIKDFVLEWVEDNQCGEGVFNLMTGNLKFFKREYLSLLKSKSIKTLKDDKNECYLFYKNCIVKVTDKKKEILSYSDCDLAIWRDQVIDRDYQPTDHHPSEYRSFIWKISGEDENKYKAFQTVIGYLLHSYKSNNNNKAIIFNDEIISDNPNGRSGKGLFWNALKQIKKVQSLDGKTFDFNKTFPYQSVSTDCQILVFDDVKKNFNFENLFSVITEGITIEYKGKDSIKLDVTESPKIIITTNYTIKGDSASFNARKYEVEMSNYFSDKYTPVMEFGHELFNDWDADEWARFDNYMIECIKIYFQMGLIEMPLKNLDYRKLIDEISIEMHRYFDSLPRNEFLDVKKVYANLLDSYPELKRYNIKQNKMTINFKKYCVYYKFDHDVNYNGGIGKLIIKEMEKENKTEIFDEPLF
jgi:hypothetical protein